MPTFTLRPADCTHEQIATFKSLVIEGGEVAGASLNGLVMRAEWLGFHTTDDARIVGVGGLKNPNAAYRAKVFGPNRADSPESADRYPFELGWFYVLEGHRHGGIAGKLRACLLRRAGDSRVYATTKETNTWMQQCLARRGFRRSGGPYPSKDGRHDLLLYVRG